MRLNRRTVLQLIQPRPPWWNRPHAFGMAAELVYMLKPLIPSTRQPLEVVVIRLTMLYRVDVTLGQRNKLVLWNSGGVQRQPHSRSHSQ